MHAALRRADVAVCFFHWGVELHAQPNARQQQFAAACLNAGAKLVLGAHPHVLGGVVDADAALARRVDARQLRLPVGQRRPARTAILHVALGADGVRGYRLVPVRIDGFRPRLAPAAQQG